MKGIYVGPDKEEQPEEQNISSSVRPMLMSSTMAFPVDGKRQGFGEGENHPEILPSELVMGDLLGKGSFSKVYKGKCRGQDVAVKIFNVQNDPDELENIRTEIAVMSQIFHPNVVLFMGACTDPEKKLMIVTERLPTDLYSLLISNKNKYNLSLRKRMKMAKEAALGINWLHSGKQKFIHRDLKLSNLLVTHDFHIRVADFGLTRLKSNGEDSEAPQGSPAYMAPEVFMGEYDEKCDVYSFGMVLWEMLTQERVFTEYPSFQQLMFAVVEEGVRPVIPKNCPTSLKHLISECWDAEAKNRPSFDKILDKLDHVMVDVSLQDHGARAMWKKNFWGKSSVPWNDFVTVLCQTLELPPPNLEELTVGLKCLSELVATAPKKKKIQVHSEVLRVKMTKFGNIIQCFGPFDGRFVRRTKKVLASKWFFGAASQVEAEEALCKHKSAGTFLIRFSSSPGFFTLSFIGKVQLEHHRIINIPGAGCLVWGQQYPDLFAVVEAGKKKTLLKKQCSGSPYAFLFPKKSMLKKAPPKPQASAYMTPTQDDLKRMYSHN